MDDRWYELGLDAGEYVVREGRPSSRWPLVAARLPAGLAGLVAIVSILGWALSVAHGGRNKWDQGRPVPQLAPHNVAIACSALVFVPTIMIMGSAVVRTWRGPQGIRYVLTNRRALVHQAEEVLSFGPEDMRVVERRDGSGDLVFGRKPTNVNGITERVGFLGVENVRQVESLVRTTLGSRNHR